MMKAIGSAFCMPLNSIQQLCQLSLSVSESTETLCGGMNGGFGLVDCRVDGRHKRIPKLYKCLKRLRIFRVKIFNIGCLLKPEKCMNMTQTPMLPFIAIPIVCDFELGFQYMLEIQFP